MLFLLVDRKERLFACVILNDQEFRHDSKEEEGPFRW